MKFRGNKYFLWGLTALLVICASICFYYLVFHGNKIRQGTSVMMNVLMPVVFGLILAYLLTPLLNFIEKKLLIPLCNKCKIKESKQRAGLIRGIGILLTVFLTILIIYSLFYMMLSQIVPSIVTIVSNFDTYIGNIIRWINQMMDDNPEVREYVILAIDKYSVELEAWMNGTLMPQASELIRTVSLSVIGVLKILWNFIIGIILSVYLLASKEKFAGQAKKIAYAAFKRDTANMVIRNFRFTHKTFIGFVSGKIVDSILIGLLCFIGTSLLNTPYAALVSVVIGVTNVIPFFGPYLGAIPSTILIFVVDPSHPLNCVYFALFILFLQQFDGNVLGPKILGDSTGLTGFWVIFAITFFGGLFGVLGMIVGVPVFAVIYAAIKSTVNYALSKRGMPKETVLYMNVGSVDDNGFHEYVPESKTESKNKKKTKPVMIRKPTDTDSTDKNEK